jgi:hypothetical protein
MAYKSAKILKARFDIELDEEVEREESTTAGSALPDAMLNPVNEAAPFPAASPLGYSPESGNPLSPDPEEAEAEADRRRLRVPQTVSEMLFVTPGRKSLVGRRRRFTTHLEREGLSAAADQKTARLLHFYVLFGLLHLLAAYGVPYAVDLRALVVVLGVLPGDAGGPALARAFTLVATPVFGRHVRRLIGWFASYGVAAVNASSPTVRAALAYAVHAAVPYAPTRDLLGLEAALKGSRADLTVERRARRKAELRAGAGGAAAFALADELGGSADGDYADDDEGWGGTGTGKGGRAATTRPSIGGSARRLTAGAPFLADAAAAAAAAVGGADLVGASAAGGVLPLTPVGVGGGGAAAAGREARRRPVTAAR